MVISMKSDCDTEIPLENFFTGKWHIDNNCLIPASELHNPIFPRSRKNETVKERSNIIKTFGVHNERTLTSSKSLNKSSDCNENLKTKSENRRRIEQENVGPEIKLNSLELPLKRRGKSQKTKIKKIRTSSSTMQGGGDDSNNVFEIQTQTDKDSARSRKDDNRNSASSCLSFENKDITKTKANNENNLNLREDSRSSVVRKDCLPNIKETAKNSDHIICKKETEFLALNVKQRGRPRKNSVGKYHIQSDSSSSSENLRKNSGDSTDSPAPLVRKVGRPKKSGRANNSDHINPNKGSFLPSPSSLNAKKIGRPRKNSVEKDRIQSESNSSSENTRKNSGGSPVSLVRKVGRPKKSERANNSEQINLNKGSHLFSPSLKKRGRPRKDASEGVHIQPSSTSSEKEQDTLGLAALPVKRRGRQKKTGGKTNENESQGICLLVENSRRTSGSSVSPVKIGRSTKRRKENEPQNIQEKGNLKGTSSRAGRPISLTKYTFDDSDVFEGDDEWSEQCVKKINARQFENYSKDKVQKEIKKKGKKTKGYMDAKTQSKKSIGVSSDNNVNQHTEQEPLKPEDCHVTAKKGTLKYLKQREKFVDAVMKEAQVEDDFLSSIIPDRVPGKKNMLSNLLASSSPDDSLTIKTPQGKGKLINSNIITPRTMKLGEWASGSPWCDTVTPSTTSSVPESEKKEALEVIYHFIRGRRRRTQPLRKVLSDRSSLSQSTFDELPTQTQLIQLPALPDIPEDRCSDSSEDDYFNSSNAP